MSENELRRIRPSFDRALEIIAAKTGRLDAERIALRNACGRVAVRALASLRASPPHDMSAMDGYALHEDDIAARRFTYALGEDIAAGSSDDRQCRPGVAFPISTGAWIPGRCGAVVAKERVNRTSDGIALHDDIRPGMNIRRRGEDAMPGDIAVTAGTRLTPAMIGALSSFGLDEIEVCRRPRLSLLVTGNELLGDVRDANGPMIAAALERIGIAVAARPIIKDDVSHMVRAIRDALESDRADVILSTGGVSVGNHDHVPAALEACGADVHFHGVAMRPGKPVLFATFPDGRLFFGLPGNPVAALAGVRFFVNHALRVMSGRNAEAGVSMELPQPGRVGLTILLKAKQRVPGSAIEILPGQQSHRLKPLIEADRWVMIRPDGESFSATAFPLDIPI